MTTIRHRVRDTSVEQFHAKEFVQTLRCCISRAPTHTSDQLGRNMERNGAQHFYPTRPSPLYREERIKRTPVRINFHSHWNGGATTIPHDGATGTIVELVNSGGGIAKAMVARAARAYNTTSYVIPTSPPRKAAKKMHV